MAHLQKYKASSVGGLLDHWAREAEDGKEHSNENIHPERTAKNRVFRWCQDGSFKSGGAKYIGQAREAFITLQQQAKARHEKKTGKALRKDAVVAIDCVVTAPKDLSQKQQPAFFREVMNFMHDRYGSGVQMGFLHLDETTPHIHVPFVPFKDGKLQASNMVNRQDLRTFHKDLQKHMDAKGIRCSIELSPEDKVSKVLSKVPHDELEAVSESFAEREMGVRKMYEDASKRDAEASQRLAEAEKVYQDAQETLRASQSVLEALEGIRQEDDDYFAKREAKIRKQQEKQRENARRVHKASSMLSHNVSRRTRQHEGHSLGWS